MPSTTTSRLRALQRRRLQLSLLQAAQPLGAFIDPTLAQFAQQARSQQTGLAESQEASAGAQAAQRLDQLARSREQFPGRVPGGTGLTGLLPNDRRGFQDLLAGQREFADLQSALAGGPPPQVQVDLSGIAAGARPPLAGPRSSALLNEQLAGIEPAGLREQRIVQGLRRAGAETRTAEAGARAAEAEARGIEAQATPLEAAQATSAARRFGLRQTPQTGATTAFAQEAAAVRDPNFPAAMQFREQEQLLGSGSPGVAIARIQQQTAQGRNQAIQSLQTAKDHAAMARLLASEGSANARQAADLASDRAKLAAQQTIALLQQRINAERFSGITGVDPEITQQLQEAQDLLRQLNQAPAPAAVPGQAGASGAPRFELLPPP